MIPLTFTMIPRLRSRRARSWWFIYPESYGWTWMNPMIFTMIFTMIMRPPFDSVQLVNITPITMVYGTYNELVTGANLNQLITGGPHIVYIYIYMIMMNPDDWFTATIDCNPSPLILNTPETKPWFFPTCQVRVVRFYQSCFFFRASSSSISSSSSSSQSRSQWAQPDLHCERQIPVGTAGPPPRAQDPSGHCRTSTATSRSQWALPDLNRDFQIAVGTAGPQPRLPDRSEHCRTSTATSRSQWALPDLNGKNVRKDVR